MNGRQSLPGTWRALTACALCTAAFHVSAQSLTMSSVPLPEYPQAAFTVTSLEVFADLVFLGGHDYPRLGVDVVPADGGPLQESFIDTGYPFPEYIKRCGEHLLLSRWFNGGFECRDAETGALEWQVNFSRLRGILNPQGIPMPYDEFTVSACDCNEDTVYVAGSFDQFRHPELPYNQARYCLAALNLDNGELRDWNPNPNGRVRALKLANGLVYVGGSFTEISGVPRAHLASLGRFSGAATPWNPPVDHDVRSMLVEPDGVYFGMMVLEDNAAYESLLGVAAYDGAVSWFGDVQGAGSEETYLCHGSDMGNSYCDYYRPPAIFSIARAGDHFYFSGFFESAGGTPVTNAAGVDREGNPLGWSPAEAPEQVIIYGDKLYTAGPGFAVYGEAQTFAAPSDLRIQSLRETEASIVWADNSSAESRVEVYGGPADRLPALLYELPPNTNGATFAGLTPNTRYQCFVRVVDANEAVADSPPFSFHTLAEMPTLGENLLISAQADSYYPLGTPIYVYNPRGFGTGVHGGTPYRVSKFRYYWRKYAHSCDFCNDIWAEGDLIFTPEEASHYWLRVESYNEDGILTAPIEFGPFYFFDPAGDNPRVSWDTHTADLDHDGWMELSELLRVLQLFNSGGFECTTAPASEDTYEPDATPVSTDCDPHDSDFAPRDWRIGLAELLRLIQLYGSGRYELCPEQESEDGYCLPASE